MDVPVPVPTVDVSAVELRFDLRVPPLRADDLGPAYQACLEMVRWADDVGVGRVAVSEHHGDPAGFMPSPITVAAALLGCTTRIQVGIAAALAPLYDPVRLAEQLATVDCIGPGRVSVILGAGYRRDEFQMAGVDPARRGRLLEEAVQVCRSAWTGQPFEWRGRTVLVTPTPATPGGPHLALGGKTELATRRAARLRCPFSPASAAPELAAAYREECRRVGYPDGVVEGLGDRPVRPGFVMVSADPDATWGAIAPHALYDAQTYASWQDDGVRSDWAMPGVVDADELRASERYVVVTPEECRALLERDGGLTLHPLMGGIPPELAWEGLRLFEAEVLPSLAPAAR